MPVCREPSYREYIYSLHIRVFFTIIISSSQNYFIQLMVRARHCRELFEWKLRARFCYLIWGNTWLLTCFQSELEILSIGHQWTIYYVFYAKILQKQTTSNVFSYLRLTWTDNFQCFYTKGLHERQTFIVFVRKDMWTNNF